MAKGIPEATVEEVKARIDLADLIASYGIDVRVAGASTAATSAVVGGIVAIAVSDGLLAVVCYVLGI